MIPPRGNDEFGQLKSPAARLVSHFQCRETPTISEEEEKYINDEDGHW